MALITPDSKVILIKNPLKLDSNNEMMFASASAQETYFKSLPKLELDNFTYIRKDGVLRVPTDETASGTTFEDLLQYNFCMYQNTHFDNKWFYAFITDYTWVNPSLTELKIETAYYQTWQHDLVFMDSFIEREHVDNDTIGNNLVDEGISPQEHIVDYYFQLPFFNASNFKVVFAVSEIAQNSGMSNIPFVSTQGNVFTGMCFITPLEPTELHPTPFTADAIVRLYDEQGHADSIKYIFMAPKELLSLSSTSYSGSLSDGTDYGYAIIENNSSYNVSLGNYNKPTTLDTYAPKNKKLLTYPYCYLSVDPHNGNLYNFNYEDIYVTGNKYAFAIDAILTVGGSAKIYPVGYKQRSGSNYTFGFTGIKYPTCGWVSDTYTNWLTQNSVNLGFATVGAKEFGLFTGIASMVTGGALAVAGLPTSGTTLMTGGFNQVFNTLQSDYKGSMQPDQVRGNENAGDINFAIGLVMSVYRFNCNRSTDCVIYCRQQDAEETGKGSGRYAGGCSDLLHFSHR